MTAEQEVYFRVRMAWLGLPVSPAIMEVIAAVLVWIAFLRAEWSDRLLFSAAAILSSTVIFGGTEGIFHLASRHWYGSTAVCGGVVSYTVCLLLAHRARNPFFAVLSILGIGYSLFLPYYATYDSLLDIAAGVLFAGAILCASFFIAERAGVKPFAAPE